MHLGLASRTLKGLRRVPAFLNAPSKLDRMVATHTGRRLNKWKHYFEVYDRHFARFRDRDVTLLEIGVDGGGSLELWRRYFGPKARIVGLDVNRDCEAHASPGTRIVIGNQADPALLGRIADECGGFDIVIDDGSHVYAHQLAAFKALFPRVRDGGIYACEDLCTSYWQQEFGGGVRHPGTFVEFLKELLDEMNAWFWREGVEFEIDAFATTAHGMHFYPALVVIEKRAMQKPIHTPVGLTRAPARRPDPA